MEQMERTAWTDERIDDAFTQLREELRDMRAEMREGFRDLREEIRGTRSELRGEIGGVREEIRGTRSELRGEIGDVRADNRSIRGEIAQLKLFMLGSYVTILAAILATRL